jgi:hypothetical protein
LLMASITVRVTLGSSTAALVGGTVLVALVSGWCVQPHVARAVDGIMSLWCQAVEQKSQPPEELTGDAPGMDPHARPQRTLATRAG